jgi:hypothetical protein
MTRNEVLGRATADLSTTLRFGRDDKGEVAVDREICYGNSAGCRSLRLLFSNYSLWKDRPPLCHLDRSEA